MGVVALQPLPADCYTNTHHAWLGASGPRLRRSEPFCLVSIACQRAPSCRPGSRQPKDIRAGELVRQTVAREVAAANSGGAKHMFRSEKRTLQRNSQTRTLCRDQRSDGRNAHRRQRPANTPQQQQAEGGTSRLVDEQSRSASKEKAAREKEDCGATLQIVKALPDAFRYEYEGTEPGNARAGKTGDQLTRLKFTPNPAYSPPSHVEQVARGYAGISC